MRLINIFLFYSILGNIFERVLMNFVDKTYISGFMGTIFTPIYGIAVLLILYIHNKIKIENKFLKIFIEFFVFLVVLTMLEFFGGILIENVFNKIFWNYDNFKYNIGKYISLESSLLWGIMSIIILYLINPLFDKIEKRIPNIVTIIISLIFIVNLIVVLLVK